MESLSGIKMDSQNSEHIGIIYEFSIPCIPMYQKAHRVKIDSPEHGNTKNGGYRK
jgi:hypothetical protein